MKSIFRYPGGKSRTDIVQWICSHKPDGVREYREPFVGGGGMFFAMHGTGGGPFERVWLNDKHTGLVEVYSALRDRADDFIAACKAIEPERDDDPLTEVGERGGKPTNARLKAVFDSLKLNTECDQALRYFFVNRTVHGSGRVNYDIPSRLYFSNPSGWNIVRNGALRDAAAALSGVRLTCGDYADVFEADGDGVWIYADPPYVVNTDLSPSSQLYQHSFAKDDHVRFAETVRACKHNVCVSYDDDDDGFIRALFDGFTIIEGAWKYAGTTDEKKRNGRELLILNYELPKTALVMEPAQSESSLTVRESDELERVERELQASLDRARDSFVTIGECLAAIRDSGKPSKRLYRATHDTFEDYCRERWGISSERATQFIVGASRFASLKTLTTVSVLPTSERQVRELSRCETDEQAAEVWQAVTDDKDPSEITAAVIREYVNAAIGYEPPQRDLIESARKAFLKLTDEQRALLLAELLNTNSEAA